MREHLEMLRTLAADRPGRLVIAGYGQDPETGQKLRPEVRSFNGDATTSMVEYAKSLTTQRHRNIYAPLALMRSDLPGSRKGSEEDVVGVLGLVADFDDGDAGNYLGRLPLAPDMVLETSAGRYQCFYVFEEPLKPSQAKPIAEALCEYAGCDHRTKDISGVWRIEGTKNWPNAKKVDAGRSPEPQEVRAVEEWGRTFPDPAELRRILDCQAAPTENVAAQARAHHVNIDNLDDGLRARIERPTPVGQRSDVFFGVVHALADADFTEADIIPEGMTTLLVADGGAGKSILCQTLMSCVPTSREFLNAETKPGCTAGLFAEDPEVILHMRQARINGVLGITDDDIAARVFIQSYAGLDARLWHENKAKPFLATLERQLSRIEELRLVVLDNAALLFSGNENDRMQVTAFINALNGIAERLSVGLVLTTHTSKSSADSDAVRALPDRPPGSTRRAAT